MGFNGENKAVALQFYQEGSLPSLLRRHEDNDAEWKVENRVFATMSEFVKPTREVDPTGVATDPEDVIPKRFTIRRVYLLNPYTKVRVGEKAGPDFNIEEILSPNGKSQVTIFAPTLRKKSARYENASVNQDPDKLLCFQIVDNFTGEVFEEFDMSEELAEDLEKVDANAGLLSELNFKGIPVGVFDNIKTGTIIESLAMRLAEGAEMYYSDLLNGALLALR